MRYISTLYGDSRVPTPAHGTNVVVCVYRATTCAPSKCFSFPSQVSGLRSQVVTNSSVACVRACPCPCPSACKVSFLFFSFLYMYIYMYLCIDLNTSHPLHFTAVEVRMRKSEKEITKKNTKNDIRRWRWRNRSPNPESELPKPQA